MGRRRSSGQTLLEVLCVISIIVALASLIFPVVMDAKRAAKGSVGLANVRNAGLAISIYSNDYDDMMPYGVDDHARTFPYLWGQFEPLIPTLPLYSDLVLPFAKNSGVFLDPLDRGLHRSENGGMAYVRQPTLFEAVGSSFNYYVDLSGRPISSYENLPNLAVLASGAGFWSCSCSEMPEGWGTPSQSPSFAVPYRYKASMADGRAKVLKYHELHL